MTWWNQIPEAIGKAEPLFTVERPDGETHWTEVERQATFFNLIRMGLPRAMCFANANAGIRNRLQASREGIRAGVFDVTVIFEDLTAWIEFKGYSGKKRRVAGRLTEAQIDFGNALIERGRICGCFFSPYSAIAFLQKNGFPIAARVRA